LTDAKHPSAFSTNHLTDADKRIKQNNTKNSHATTTRIELPQHLQQAGLQQVQ